MNPENLNQIVEIFTDGACKGNPGKGGWAAILRWQGHEKVFSGAETVTTNNRMELKAAIEGLKALTRPCSVVVTTDSQYVRKGITEWLPMWKKMNWKKKDKSEIKNLDLWQQLDQVASKHQIQWLWVKGHQGHEGNELADYHANKAIENYTLRP